MESEQQRFDHAVDVAVDLGITVLKNGGSTRAADRTFRKVLQGCGQDQLSSAWRLDVVTARSVSSGHAANITRPVGRIGVNLLRVSKAIELADRVSRGEVNQCDLDAEIVRINALPPQYSMWLAVVAAACSAVGFARLCGADWPASASAGIATTVGKFLGNVLQAQNAPVAPVTLICGMVSSGIAALALRFGVSGMGPSTLVASIIYLTPGLPLINGFVDIVSERYLIVGVERIANAALIYAVIAIAVELTVGMVL